MLFSFFSWSMSGGTELKLQPMLDFNPSAKQLKVVSPTSFYTFQGGLITVLRVDQLNPLKSGYFS